MLSNVPGARDMLVSGTSRGFRPNGLVYGGEGSSDFRKLIYTNIITNSAKCHKAYVIVESPFPYPPYLIRSQMLLALLYRFHQFLPLEHLLPGFCSGLQLFSWLLLLLAVVCSDTSGSSCHALPETF